MALEPKPYIKAAFDREEKLFFLKAGLLILAIYFFQQEIFSLAGYFAIYTPFFFFAYIWFKSLHTGERVIDILKEHITFIPIAYTEGSKKLFIPRATILLVLINILVFYLMKLTNETGINFITNNFIFLPVKTTWWNILVSPITNMFLHANAGHLWGNMVSFWAFGPAVEERVEAGKFFSLYFVTGLLGSLTSVFVFRLFFSGTLHGLGASGAIAGITGVFIVRCYFKKLVVPLPLFGLLNIKLRVNSLLPLGFLFLMDMKGGIQQLAGSNSRIGYWAHVGSLVAGMLIAARLKLQKAAAEEKYTEQGLAAMDDQYFRRDSVDSLKTALQLNPENEAALLGLAREYAVSRKPEGRELFQQAIRLKLRSSPEQAVAMYKEYLNSYNRMLEPDLQYRLAGIFYRQGDHEPATRALEMIVLEPSASDDTRQRAFYQLIIILAENNMLEAAHYRLRQFQEQYPESELLKAAGKKII